MPTVLVSILLFLSAFSAFAEMDSCFIRVLSRRTSSGPFKEIAYLPRINKPLEDRKVSVFIGDDLWVGRNDYWNIFGKPGTPDMKVPSRVLEDFDLQNLDKAGLLKRIKEAAEDSDVIVIAAHANPTRITFRNGEIFLGPEDFRGIDLTGKTIVLQGCFTGACGYEPKKLFQSYDAYKDVAGQKVPEAQRLLEGIMRETNAQAAIGIRFWLGSNDAIESGLYHRLILEGGGQPLSCTNPATCPRVIQRREWE